MSEYRYVERPFLDQLAALGWVVIDQGEGVPIDPAASLRTDFREVVIKGEFFAALDALNRLPDGRAWLTDAQKEDLYEEISGVRLATGKSLLEVNEAILKLLFKIQVDRNEVTGEEYPTVTLIDFENPDRNRFVAINQYRIDTPGRTRDHVRPDIVLFVNGMPLVVVECKDANEFTSNPMYECFLQLMRYSNQRPETKAAGLREGDERLFFTNQLLIRTCGEKADYGSITSTDEEYFFVWRDIYPDANRTYTPPLGKERAQEKLIQGMLPKATLLDIIRSFVIFMDTGKQRVKVVPRYQQYRAVGKMLARMETGARPEERSGVVWHTQGSGKSLTMVFAIRKLRRTEALKDYKIVLVNDRVDLEDQLSETATLSGETVTVIQSSQELKEKLATTSSNLNMVMMHKFREASERNTPDYLAKALKGGKPVPEFASFGEINTSDRILLMIDEAHRTQGSDLGDNLFEAFPRSTKVAFTGTPLIMDRHVKKTWQRFGGYIDKYRLHDAVEDGATVQILYEGRTAETAINDPAGFETKFEDLFKDRTEAELIAIKLKYGTSGDIFEAPKRIEAIAKDLVRHYAENILPNGFKAQVVSSSKMAAVLYRKYIDQALKEYVAAERMKPNADPAWIKKLEFLKTAVVVSADETNEKAEITAARKEGKLMDAVENFKRKFEYDDPEKANTGIALLCVCDMLLTGFDAPIEQVMYLDKRLTEHSLLQAIARVNRVSKGKSRGYVVDYIGLAGHLKEALGQYSREDADPDEKQDIEDSLKNIETEVPILESRYQRLVNLFKDKGVGEIEAFVQQRMRDPKQTYAVLEQAVEALKDIRMRATFEVYLKQFMQSLDIVLPHTLGNPFKVPVKRFGYILAQTRERYKDNSLNLAGAGEKVKRLIDEHLISLGINPKIAPIELIDPNFVKGLSKHANPRAKASEMEHAIRKHIKVHIEEDPALYTKLSEKLEALIQKHKEDWTLLCKELDDLRQEVEKGRETTETGVPPMVAPFHDLMVEIAYGNDGTPKGQEEPVKILAAAVFGLFKERIGLVAFWSKGYEVARLKGDLAEMLLVSDIEAIMERSDKLVTELTALARARHKDVVG
ncbi:MAG: type I restriction endonuclease subunit R [Phycisphaeraceae bacterium]|nr:MAG: type I restriction endonuclease subunit R [Phycisphaeraceae bacterium]